MTPADRREARAAARRQERRRARRTAVAAEVACRRAEYAAMEAERIGSAADWQRGQSSVCCRLTPVIYRMDLVKMISKSLPESPGKQARLLSRQRHTMKKWRKNSSNEI